MSLLTNFRTLFSAAFSALKNGAILGGHGNWLTRIFVVLKYLFRTDFRTMINGDLSMEIFHNREEKKEEEVPAKRSKRTPWTMEMDEALMTEVLSEARCTDIKNPQRGTLDQFWKEIENVINSEYGNIFGSAVMTDRACRDHYDHLLRLQEKN